MGLIKVNVDITVSVLGKDIVRLVRTAGAPLTFRQLKSSVVAVLKDTEQLFDRVEEGPPTYELVLTDLGVAKIGVIKAVREITHLGLKEAKEVVEAPLPVRVETYAERDAAEAGRRVLLAGGAAAKVVERFSGEPLVI